MSTDPFASIPDAVRTECEIRMSAPRRASAKACGWSSKERKPKKTDLNPFERRYLTAQGYTHTRVDQFNAYGGRAKDLFGFADMLAFRPGDILLVQLTDKSSISKRLQKARATAELWRWLEAGGRFEVHGWHQPQGKGSRWEVEVREVVLAEAGS